MLIVTIVSTTAILEISTKKVKPIEKAIEEAESKHALTKGPEPQDNTVQSFIQIPKSNSVEDFDFVKFLKVHAGDDSPFASHIISAIKLKFEAGEATWTVMKWCKTVLLISEQDLSFPLDLIPVSNVDAMKVLDKIVEKRSVNERVQQELLKERQGIAKEFLNNDSEALLEGAMRFLEDGKS